MIQVLSTKYKGFPVRKEVSLLPAEGPVEDRAGPTDDIPARDTACRGRAVVPDLGVGRQPGRRLSGGPWDRLPEDAHYPPPDPAAPGGVADEVGPAAQAQLH